MVLMCTLYLVGMLPASFKHCHTLSKPGVHASSSIYQLVYVPAAAGTRLEPLLTRFTKSDRSQGGPRTERTAAGAPPGGSGGSRIRMAGAAG